jgi:cell wall-associated NlpC family hydrolase
MLRVRGRGTTRTTPLLLLAAISVVWLIVPTTAGAGSIAQTKKAIEDLSAALSRQEARSEISSNQYDQDQANLAAINSNITNLQGQEAAKRAAIVVTAKKLEVDVVRAFVFGSAQAQLIQLFNQNVTKSDQSGVYQQLVIGNLNQLKNKYQREKTSLDTTIAKVAAQRSRARHATDEMKALLESNIELQDQTQATLATVTARYKSEIIIYEIGAGVAAARDHNTAGEDQAISAASAVGGQDAANQVIEAEQQAVATPTIAEVAGTAQGLAAVKYAESQIGVPYVWGGETPGVGFDCSGLVQWAWSKAGISIPRTTESQYPDMVHVLLTQLQPGDLLYYYNLDGDHQVDHVVMYVGSGPWGVDTTIAAAHTGTNVELAPLFTAGLYGATHP